jgi:Reverse transcriptase (RNA-dependent DNA polymerase)
MGLCNSPDFFQVKMSELMAGLEFVPVYIDDLQVITKVSYPEHLNKLEVVLTQLQDTGLKVNANKPFFARESVESLGCTLSQDSIMPQSTKVEAIQWIAEPKNKKDLGRFIGLVNCYRDMWEGRSETLAPANGNELMLKAKSFKR